MLTLAPAEKFDPEIVTAVPPDVGPLVGAMLATRGPVGVGPLGEPPPPSSPHDAKARTARVTSAVRKLRPILTETW
jgi:hypothetical protein